MLNKHQKDKLFTFEYYFHNVVNYTLIFYCTIIIILLLTFMMDYFRLNYMINVNPKYKMYWYIEVITSNKVYESKASYQVKHHTTRYLKHLFRRIFSNIGSMLKLSTLSF